MEHFRNKSVRSAHQGQPGKTKVADSIFCLPVSFLSFFFNNWIFAKPSEYIKQSTMVPIYF